MRRRGFTLLELLMVIVIIGVLAALLLPAIGSAVSAARNAAVQSEIGGLASAIAAYRSTYGEHPPSRVVLCEDGNYGRYWSASNAYTLSTPNALDQSDAAIAQRSVSFLRKFFPRMALASTNTTVYTAAAPFPDFNGNGKLDGPVVLSGDEALVWFLGGQPVPTGTTWSLTGLARSSANPFQAGGQNRSTPLYEFDAGRLVDFDGDGYPSYVDSLKTNRPYVYFSAYGGAGYDPNDTNFDIGSPMVESDDAATTTPITLRFQTGTPINGGGTKAVSPSPNPYSFTGTMNPVVNWFQPTSFQILSAGADGQYGVGGSYEQTSPIPLPLDAANTSPATDGTIRVRENDNLANFHPGKLQ